MRSIVAGIGSIGEKLSIWIDHVLQPLVFKLPVFLQDTKDVVRMTENAEWTSQCGGLSCDVVG